MLLTVQELVDLLRSSVNVQNSELGVVDSNFLDMTDSELELFIKLGSTSAYPDITSLDELPDGADYPVLLLAKIELYMKLAVLRANDKDIKADNNNELKLSQRFTHYMSLASEARTQYKLWYDNGGGYATGGVRTFNVTLSRNHCTNYNYRNLPLPKVRLTIGVVTNDSVEFDWSVTNTDHFGYYRVYISKSSIVDKYQDGNLAQDKVKSGATEIKRTINFRETQHRISGLEPNTTYYVAVFSVEKNLLFGYAEKSFTTLEAFTSTEELNVSSL